MARILKGEIRWAHLDPVRGHEQAGHRPILILSGETFNARSRTVIAMAITSKQPAAGYPFSMEIKAGLLPKRSWIKITQIRTLSLERVGDLLDRLAPSEVQRVIGALNEILNA